MTDPSAADIAIRPPAAGDRPEWERLYRGYAAFYRVPMTDGILDTVWSWLHDPEAEVNGFVAAAGGGLVGLAHYRRFARPLRGAVGIFLDDLYSDPSLRGGGIGRKLIGAVEGIAARQGLGLVRWITADDNYRARILYDQMATRTSWLTYDLTLD